MKMTTYELTGDFEKYTFGVEVETSGLEREAVARGLATAMGWEARRAAIPGYYDKWEVVQGDGRAWTSMTDGSIHGVGTEVVSPILRGAADLEVLQAVVRALRGLGCKSSASLGCGIHVHVGVKHLEVAAVGRLAKVVAKHDALIRQAVAVAPDRARWCAPVEETKANALGTAKNRKELARAWYGVNTDAQATAAAQTHYHQSRYRGLNLHSMFYTNRNTAEFRYFNGTLHAGEVKSYVQLAVALVSKAERSKSASAKAVATGHSRGPLATWRQFMLSLGLVGDTYKTAREHLSKHFPPEVTRAATAPVAATVAA